MTPIAIKDMKTNTPPDTEFVVRANETPNTAETTETSLRSSMSNFFWDIDNTSPLWTLLKRLQNKASNGRAGGIWTHDLLSPRQAR